MAIRALFFKFQLKKSWTKSVKIESRVITMSEISSFKMILALKCSLPGCTASTIDGVEVVAAGFLPHYIIVITRWELARWGPAVQHNTN